MPYKRKKVTNITKPTKKKRDTTNAIFLKLEDEQKELASNHCTRIYSWKKDPKNKNKPSNNVDPSIKKQREKSSKLRYTLRMSHEVVVTKNTTDFGDYYLIDCVPIVDMTQLLINFKTPEFRDRYDIQKANITACNDHLNADQYSTYWLLNNNKGSDIAHSGTWEDQKSTSCSNDIVLSNFMTKVANGLNKELQKNKEIQKPISFNTIPGFVETTFAAHQNLHMDREINNFKTADKSYILHVPLDYEGMQLRLGKVDENLKLKHDFIHVPFGSGILLHWTQLHAGHYGSPGNYRFHAVLSEGAWYGSKLFPLNKYLELKTKDKEVEIDSIVDEFDNERETTSAEMIELHKYQKTYRTTYYNHLKRYNPSPGFLSLVKDIDNDYKIPAKNDMKKKK